MKRYPKRGRAPWGRRKRPTPVAIFRRAHARAILAAADLVSPAYWFAFDSPGGTVADLARATAPLAYGGPLVQLAIDGANRAEVERAKRRIREMAESGEVYVMPRCGSIGARSALAYDVPDIDPETQARGMALVSERP